MDHGLDVMVPQCAANGIGIQQIRFDQWAPLNGPAMPQGQVVQADRQITGRCQCFAGVAADIAGAAGDQNRYRLLGIHSCVAFRNGPGILLDYVP
jgi:hypothetical protein